MASSSSSSSSSSSVREPSPHSAQTASAPTQPVPVAASTRQPHHHSLSQGRSMNTIAMIVSSIIQHDSKSSMPTNDSSAEAMIKNVYSFLSPSHQSTVLYGSTDTMWRLLGQPMVMTSWDSLYKYALELGKAFERHIILNPSLTRNSIPPLSTLGSSRNSAMWKRTSIVFESISLPPSAAHRFLVGPMCKPRMELVDVQQAEYLDSPKRMHEWHWRCTAAEKFLFLVSLLGPNGDIDQLMNYCVQSSSSSSSSNVELHISPYLQRFMSLFSPSEDSSRLPSCWSWSVRDPVYDALRVFDPFVYDLAQVIHYQQHAVKGGTTGSDKPLNQLGQFSQAILNRGISGGSSSNSKDGQHRTPVKLDDRAVFLFFAWLPWHLAENVGIRHEGDRLALMRRGMRLLLWSMNNTQTWNSEVTERSKLYLMGMREHLPNVNPIAVSAAAGKRGLNNPVHDWEEKVFNNFGFKCEQTCPSAVATWAMCILEIQNWIKYTAQRVGGRSLTGGLDKMMNRVQCYMGTKNFNYSLKYALKWLSSVDFQAYESAGGIEEDIDPQYRRVVTDCTRIYTTPTVIRVRPMTYLSLQYAILSNAIVKDIEVQRVLSERLQMHQNDWWQPRGTCFVIEGVSASQVRKAMEAPMSIIHSIFSQDRRVDIDPSRGRIYSPSYGEYGIWDMFDASNHGGSGMLSSIVCGDLYSLYCVNALSLCREYGERYAYGENVKPRNRTKTTVLPVISELFPRQSAIQITEQDRVRTASFLLGLVQANSHTLGRANLPLCRSADITEVRPWSTTLDVIRACVMQLFSANLTVTKSALCPAPVVTKNKAGSLDNVLYDNDANFLHTMSARLPILLWTHREHTWADVANITDSQNQKLVDEMAPRTYARALIALLWSVFTLSFPETNYRVGNSTLDIEENAKKPLLRHLLHVDYRKFFETMKGGPQIKLGSTILPESTSSSSSYVPTEARRPQIFFAYDTPSFDSSKYIVLTTKNKVDLLKWIYRAYSRPIESTDSPIWAILSCISVHLPIRQDTFTSMFGGLPPAALGVRPDAKMPVWTKLHESTELVLSDQLSLGKEILDADESTTLDAHVAFCLGLCGTNMHVYTSPLSVLKANDTLLKYMFEGARNRLLGVAPGFVSESFKMFMHMILRVEYESGSPIHPIFHSMRSEFLPRSAADATMGMPAIASEMLSCVVRPIGGGGSSTPRAGAVAPDFTSGMTSPPISVRDTNRGEKRQRIAPMDATSLPPSAYRSYAHYSHQDDDDSMNIENITPASLMHAGMNPHPPASASSSSSSYVPAPTSPPTVCIPQSPLYCPSSPVYLRR